MVPIFELLFPLLWVGLGLALSWADRWKATLFATFYLFCLACEAVAIQFGEYYYDGHFQAKICLGPPLLGQPISCVHLGGCLPLAVPCMEGIFFFAGWIWAARREENPALRPLFAAMLAVIADLAFDPIGAQSFEMATFREWPGVGLWYWGLDPADPGHYFGIPVDNALAWIATCCGFGYAALLLPRWQKVDPQKAGFWRRLALALQVAPLGLVLAGFFFFLLDVLITPPGTGAGYRESALFILLGLLYAWALWRAWRRKPPAAAASRAEKTAGAVAAWTLAAALGYVMTALLRLEDDPGLWPLWLGVVAALGLYWAAGKRPMLKRS